MAERIAIQPPIQSNVGVVRLNEAKKSLEQRQTLLGRHSLQQII